MDAVVVDNGHEDVFGWALNTGVDLRQRERLLVIFISLNSR